jgi:hypothetical protein
MKKQKSTQKRIKKVGKIILTTLGVIGAVLTSARGVLEILIDFIDKAKEVF